MRILFATSNPHKVDEVREIFAPLGINITSLDPVDNTLQSPDETGDTFAENARLKAKYYAKELGATCLAEDSGLEVDALGGKPGVRSARYAGTGSTRAERDKANNAKLLLELKNIPQEKRTARFVCVMCLANSDGNILAETRGTYEGIITDTPRGTNGFGYDPLLYLPDCDCTSAELSPEDKNERSHRGKATRKMAEELRRLQCV